MTKVMFIGEMYNADVGIGGGPIIPAPQPPLGIWGPTDPRPTHPIAGYPWPQPPQPPLGIWGPTDPRPSHPIAGYPWGPVDPGYSPPWARPPVDPGYSPPWARPPGGGGPVDPGYSPPWARPPVDPDYGIDTGHRPTHPIYIPGAPPGAPGSPTNPIYLPPHIDNALPPFAAQLPIIPPQTPVVDPVDPNKAHLVALTPKADGSGYDKTTFTVEWPLPEVPPGEATPKPV